MLINILGYITYGILIFLAISWGIGVRKKLDASNWTIFGAFLFLLSAILLFVLKLNLINSIWIIPVIYVIILLIPYIYVYNIPLVKDIITAVATLYANLLRLGLKK